MSSALYPGELAYQETLLKTQKYEAVIVDNKLQMNKTKQSVPYF